MPINPQFKIPAMMLPPISYHCDICLIQFSFAQLLHLAPHQVTLFSRLSSEVLK